MVKVLPGINDIVLKPSFVSIGLRVQSTAATATPAAPAPPTDNLVDVFVDGVKVRVAPGTTVLQVWRCFNCAGGAAGQDRIGFLLPVLLILVHFLVHVVPFLVPLSFLFDDNYYSH